MNWCNELMLLLLYIGVCTYIQPCKNLELTNNDFFDKIWKILKSWETTSYQWNCFEESLTKKICWRVEQNCQKCFLCKQTPCKWFNYAAGVNNYSRKWIHLLNKKATTTSIAMKTRRFQIYRFLEKVVEENILIFPPCVEREEQSLFPDLKDEYVGFKNK